MTYCYIHLCLKIILFVKIWVIWGVHPLEVAINCGCDFNYDEFKLYFPEGCVYNKNQIITPNGKSFKVRLLNPQNPRDKMMLKSFQKIGQPSITLSVIEKNKKCSKETYLTWKK